MATFEQLKKAREKAIESPYIGKRGKGLKTIEKEKRQAIFDEIVSQEFEKLIAQAKPEYKLDRFMGAVPQELNIKSQAIKIQLSGKLTKQLKEELKQNLLDATE